MVAEKGVCFDKSTTVEILEAVHNPCPVAVEYPRHLSLSQLHNSPSVTLQPQVLFHSYMFTHQSFFLHWIRISSHQSSPPTNPFLSLFTPPWYPLNSITHTHHHFISIHPPFVPYTLHNHIILTIHHHPIGMTTFSLTTLLPMHEPIYWGWCEEVEFV